MSEQENTLQPLTSSQREFVEESVRTYQAGFTASAAKYLSSRGLDRADAIGARLGVVREPMPGHGWYQGWLAIPYLDKNGAALSLRFRCLQEHDHVGHGKYMSLLGDPIRTYNVGAVHRAKNEIHICEGELDALILQKIGLDAIALPGVNAWKPRHRKILAGFSTIYVWADPDKAGDGLLAKITNSLRNARPVRLKGGDITDNYIKGGEDALFAALGKERQ